MDAQQQQSAEKVRRKKPFDASSAYKTFGHRPYPILLTANSHAWCVLFFCIGPKICSTFGMALVMLGVASEKIEHSPTLASGSFPNLKLHQIRFQSRAKILSHR